MIILGAVFMLMIFLIFILYGIFASAISKTLVNSPQAIRWMQRSFAVTFAVLAIKLALSQK